MDNQTLFLYAKGMAAREIAAAFKKLYDADVSSALVSKVTDAVMEQVTEWQNRPLDALHPIVYLDCIVLKIRLDSRVINKSVFLAQGINIEDKKDLLGMWLAEYEGAKFWLNVFGDVIGLIVDITPAQCAGNSRWKHFLQDKDLPHGDQLPRLSGSTNSSVIIISHSSHD